MPVTQLRVSVSRLPCWQRFLRFNKVAVSDRLAAMGCNERTGGKDVLGWFWRNTPGNLSRHFAHKGAPHGVHYLTPHTRQVAMAQVQHKNQGYEVNFSANEMARRRFKDALTVLGWGAGAKQVVVVLPETQIQQPYPRVEVRVNTSDETGEQGQLTQPVTRNDDGQVQIGDTPLHPRQARQVLALVEAAQESVREIRKNNPASRQWAELEPASGAKQPVARRVATKKARSRKQ